MTLEELEKQIKILNRALDMVCLELANNVDLKDKQGNIVFPRRRYWKEIAIEKAKKEIGG